MIMKKAIHQNQEGDMNTNNYPVILNRKEIIGPNNPTLCLMSYFGDKIRLLIEYEAEHGIPVFAGEFSDQITDIDYQLFFNVIKSENDFLKLSAQIKTEIRKKL